jgi:NarL family two-component system sensor histidine kinase YdfH
MNGTNQKSPFRWFLLLWVGLVYVQSVQTRIPGGSIANPGTKVPPPGTATNPQFDLLLFTLFMVLHGGLHWVAFSLRRSRDLLLYFLMQGLVVLSISFLAQVQGATTGLCLALTIEAIVLFKHPRLMILVGSGCFLLFALTEGAQFISMAESGSINKLTDALTGSTTLVFFVIACILLYTQQSRARERDQTFLHELEIAHTELKTTHEQLARAHDQLEEYAAQVEDLTLITERQRLARELHDTLAQGLVGLVMQLETIDALLLKQHGDQARAIVQQAMMRARTTITEARAVIDDLRGNRQDWQNFSQIVQSKIQQFIASTGISCDCLLPETLLLPPAVREHLLRLLAEGLMNITRHARATQVWVRAAMVQDTLMFEIRDNGVGFDPASIARQEGHYGFLGLQERARLLHGKLCIVSAPGKGTTIRLHLPGRSGEREK